jgi:hypothetical protein
LRPAWRLALAFADIWLNLWITQDIEVKMCGLNWRLFWSLNIGRLMFQQGLVGFKQALVSFKQATVVGVALYK